MGVYFVLLVEGAKQQRLQRWWGNKRGGWYWRCICSKFFDSYTNYRITCLMLNSAAKWVSLALDIDPCHAFAIDIKCCSLVSVLPSSAKCTPKVWCTSEACKMVVWQAHPILLVTLVGTCHCVKHIPTCCWPTLSLEDTRRTSLAPVLLQLHIKAQPID